MSVEVMQERVHHPYSPSTLQSLEVCESYRGKESFHPRTLAGTLAHGVAESGKDDHRLSDDDAAAAAECLDFVEQRRQLFIEERQRVVAAMSAKLSGEDCGERADRMISECIEIKESYLPIDDMKFKETWISPFDHKTEEIEFVGTTAGYIDHGFISWNRKRAEIYDWKFGFWPVEDAANNLQGLAYALGAFKMYPTLEQVEFFFKQPHLGTVSNVPLKRSDIGSIYLRICVIVEKARLARQKGTFDNARPHIPLCNFCRNIGVCPKVGAVMLKVASKFYPLEVPENITPTMLIEGKDAALCMRVAGIAAIWGDAIKRQTTNRVVAGVIQPPPGYCLQQRQDREIADREKFEQTALLYVTEKEYRGCCDVGFGKLEKVINDKSPRGQKSAQISSFNNALAEAGATKKGEPYVFLRAVSTKTKDDSAKQ